MRLRDSQAIRIATMAALVAGGCFAGAWVDTWLVFPGTGAAVFFAPYAILTAALLRSPVRVWWILVLAASAGNFFPHWRAGASVPFIVLAELTNHLRAVTAALGIRRFAGRSSRLDTMQEMVAYLAFAVFLAPCAAGLAGAGIVIWQLGVHPFWLAWQEWSLSNATTGLTLLPLIMIGARDVGAILRTRRARRPIWGQHGVRAKRAIEASLLLVGLLAAAGGVFMVPREYSSTHPTRLYWPLPLLLWTAVRFGPRGTSAALLVVTYLGVMGAVAQQGPFAAQSPGENMLELQLFLVAIAVPLLLLSALLRQQRRTALALEQSRRQYQSVVEDQTEMVCRYRPDGTYTFVNGAYCSTFGRDARDLVGGNIWRLTPAGVHRTQAELADAVSPDHPVAARETSAALPGGETRWQNWRDRGLFDAAGAVVEYQSVGRDITDRKRAENKRRQLDAQKLVEEALREADRRKDEFLAMLGHELRNPLAPIGIALEIMRQAPGDSSEAAWARDAIGRQLEQLTRLVDDLLDISRVTQGKIRLRAETVDLGAVVANAVETTRPLIDSSRHQLTVSLPEGGVHLHGDSARLTQVVANLLNNAAKYTEPGGHIQLAVRAEEDAVVLSVRDDGIGIPPSALGSIFELFRQVPETRDRTQGGLGIGLTLVKRLVELHDGQVEARSAGPGQGTEVVVRLPPAAAAPVVEPAAPERPSARPGASLRILAVDDNADVADGLAHVLGTWGHTVRTAGDGAAALELASAFAPDVVLLDLGLPRIDGFEVARRIRADGHGVLLVSMSGFGQDETRRRSDEAGFAHHLVKPVDVESLHALLERHAGRIAHRE